MNLYEPNVKEMRKEILCDLVRGSSDETLAVVFDNSFKTDAGHDLKNVNWEQSRHLIHILVMALQYAMTDPFGTVQKYIDELSEIERT